MSNYLRKISLCVFIILGMWLIIMSADLIYNFALYKLLIYLAGFSTMIYYLVTIINWK